MDSSSSSIVGKGETQATPPEQPPPNPHSKPCMLCQRRRDVLIRCQIDNTSKWYLICTGKCWQSVSGGQVEGGSDYPHYKYGGMWKNKHEVASAKIKGKAKEENSEGPYHKSLEHRRWGHSSKGKNRKDKVHVFDARAVEDDFDSETDDDLSCDHLADGGMKGPQLQPSDMQQ